MAECQTAYDDYDATKLYKLTWTTVNSHAHVEHVEHDEGFAHVKLSHKTQTLIVEAVEGRVDPPDAWGAKQDGIDGHASSWHDAQKLAQSADASSAHQERRGL